jgi:2-C-methyl-D-erythritol 4-phosphate cytidylyltransferase
LKAGLLLLAAGEGERFGGAMPKALVPLAGTPILIRSLTPFLGIRKISDIVVAAPPRFLAQVRTLLERVPRARIIAGGQTRQESASLAFAALSTDIDFVLTHDAARPLVSRELIESVLAAAEIHGAAIAALPSVDTVKRVHQGFVEATLRREVLWTVQTPQAFRLSLFREAHVRAAREDFAATDDAALIEHFHLSEVAVVEGSSHNIKITHPKDLALAEFYLTHP